ncbi:MAG: hypothetical protein NTU72_13620 [Fimbriimonadales bacterium]|nr:hypothetical protein [Fimbriimonadales bacterium]
MPQKTAEQLQFEFRRFTAIFSIVIALIVALPTLMGLLMQPIGFAYLGIQYNFDDHMVYAGWMRQAMEGRLLFENRFTTIDQPGLTLNIWFLVLGWIAKLIGIPLAMFSARVVTTFTSVLLLGKLVDRVSENLKDCAEPLKATLLGYLPTDVWQPEGFFLPSALTNGLFMVSLTLILFIFICVLDSKENVNKVAQGAVAMGVLMNIHSYDALLIGLVLIGFICSLLGAKLLSKEWFLRGCFIIAGSVPFALWFIYVLKNDPVFQARAATETFSPNFRAVIGGYFWLIGMGSAYLAIKKSYRLSLAVFSITLILLVVFATSHLQDGYYLGFSTWIVGFSALCFACWNLKESKSDGERLIIVWAMLSLFIPYFPALFQRKLLMMAAIPWGILAGLLLAQFLGTRERSQRTLAAILGILILSASNIKWISRELLLARLNVSNTAVHNVYLSKDLQSMLSLTESGGRNIVIGAQVGGMNQETDNNGRPVLDSFVAPIIPDINPIFVGLSGNRTYAGHWSETPDYARKRGELERALASFSPQQLKSLGITHAIYSNAYLNQLGIPSKVEQVGEVLFRGKQWTMIKI